MIRIFLATLTLIAPLAPAASAQTGPRIRGDATEAACQIALAMAQTAFYATNPSIVWPLSAPDPAKAVIVLAAKASDISGGDGIAADPAVFERIALHTKLLARDFLYWQRNPMQDQRLALIDKQGGWRGDWYDLFTVASTLSQDDFLAAYLDWAISTATAPDNPPPLTPVLGNSRWWPHLLLQDPQSGAIWALDQGERYDVMPPWAVYIAGTTGMTSPCEISFGPDGSSGLARLPAAVRHFAALLDRTLGSGDNEGTLHQTARLRGAIETAWATLAARPWALTAAPYNSRAEVDAGMATWARVTPARASLYRQIGPAYAKAERALATYIAATFPLSRPDARHFATYAMDHMLRSYFVFPSTDQTPRTNAAMPWPATAIPSPIPPLPTANAPNP